MSERGYKAGYRKGLEDARANPDPTWQPSGAGSDYEEGYNDGYRGFERACPACLGADTGGKVCSRWGTRARQT